MRERIAQLISFANSYVNQMSVLCVSTPVIASLTAYSRSIKETSS